MSRTDSAVDFDTLPSPICEFCGGTIDDVDQECPARDDGRCQP